jgi:CDP-diacylglycerol--glycerol-3-phosphate 3-phosphatidyltransferase
VTQLDRDGWLDGWQALHGGYDPRRNPVVGRWLSLVFAVGRPVARVGVHPDVLTWLSLVAALGLLVTPAWAGLLLVLVSAVLDSLDGCVAVLQGRASRWGYVLDSAVDRCCDALFVAAIVVHGGTVELGIGCGFGVFLLEYVRARAGNAGAGDIHAVTVAERPTRVLVTAGALALGLGTAGLWVLTALTAVGLVQLVVTIRRQLLDM